MNSETNLICDMHNLYGMHYIPVVGKSVCTVRILYVFFSSLTSKLRCFFKGSDFLFKRHSQKEIVTLFASIFDSKHNNLIPTCRRKTAVFRISLDFIFYYGKRGGIASKTNVQHKILLIYLGQTYRCE